MHSDPELLGLLALGEHAGTENERLHAQTCLECADELSELYRLVDLGRTVGAEMTMTTPSPSVWARIRDELDFDPELELPAVSDSVTGSATTKPASEYARWSPLAGIKAALTAASNGRKDQPTAQARLAPVEPLWSHASGTAELATDERGRRVLQVALQVELPPSGVRQAWLVHRDDPTLRQTLGILDGTNGLWTVAHSIDLEKFSILDISQQGTGETEHSGQTIVRGELSLVS